MCQLTDYQHHSSQEDLTVITTLYAAIVFLKQRISNDD